MIDETLENIKIIDVGEAEESRLDKDIELECVGSPLYMAPEMIRLTE
jgi:serine/threonine protein kinase